MRQPQGGRADPLHLLAPAQGRLQCLQRGPQPPEASERIATEPEIAETGGKVLACARCRREVTTSGARIAVGGAHEHAFSNPEGVRFHIGCFDSATGCMAVGPRSTYWTWFPGYSWQVELCGNCSVQLGWLFRAAGHRFHGFILDRLVELESDPEPGR